MSTSKLIKNSGIYVVVSILQKCISFFLLPVYTAFLTPADYGVLNVILSITSLLSVFFLLGLNGAAARFHYSNLDDESQIKKIWGTLSPFVVINSVILGAVFIAFHHYLLTPFAKGVDFFPFLFLGIVNTILSPLYLFFQTYLQTKQDSVRYGTNMLLNFLLNVGLIIFFVVCLRKGVIGILLANIITSIAFFIYVLISFIPKITIILDKEILKSGFKYSLPLIPHSLSGWLMSMVDRIFVNNIIGHAETGLYSVGFQFGNIVNAFATAVNQAYAPWFFEREKKGEIQQTIKVAELLTLAYCFIALGISLFTSDVLKIMVSKNFQSAWRFTSFISFAYVFNGLYFFFVNVLFLKQTKWVPIVTFSAAIVGLTCNILLIPTIGGIGASISCLLSQFTGSLLALIFSMKVEKFRYNYIRMYLYVFLFFLVSLIIYLPIFASLSYFFALKTCIFLSLLLAFGLMYKKQINVLWGIVKKR